MNNSQGSFIHKTVKQSQNLKTKIKLTEFHFEDICSNGSFLFKEMKLELSENGNWRFFITAQGKSTTTVLKNGRKSGPCLYIGFKDEGGHMIEEVRLGQVNYSCKEEAMNSFICKGFMDSAGKVTAVEVRYESFVDFACRPKL